MDEKVEITITPPKMYKVVFLNDDSTPMELVIDILQSVFKHQFSDAQKITLEIHNSGSGIAGVYPLELAETFSIEATHIARKNGSPLKIQVEQE